MEKSIFITGAGGHGVQSAGKAIALAAFDSGLLSTFSPKYGIEKRGGLSSCYVVVSDEQIGNPRKSRNDIAVIIDAKSYEQFKNDVRPSGILIVNSSLIEDDGFVPTGCARMDVPFHDIAVSLGATASLSTLIMGFTAGVSGIFESADALARYFPSKVRQNDELMRLNTRVLNKGWELAFETDKRNCI